MKAEGKAQKTQAQTEQCEASGFILHPSSFILSVCLCASVAYSAKPRPPVLLSAKVVKADAAAGTALIRDQGANAILLGGTDLNLVYDGTGFEHPVIDSAAVHADAIVAYALATTSS